MTRETPAFSAEPTPLTGSLGDSDPRRALPSVDRLIQAAKSAGLMEMYGLQLLTVQAQRLLEARRAKTSLAAEQLSLEGLLGDLSRALEASRGVPLRRVINATGVFLHTNLGRAPLPPEALEALGPALDAGCDLEIDLTSGRRGDRNLRASALLSSLTGAEAGLVVNNNAAALVLALATLARGRQVVVSRGELVEIGGSFRIPEILQSAGAELVEVGTTNRTRIADYQAAIQERTALLLKVYPSNYRIKGFTSSVRAAELAELARTTSVPLLVDEGSGLLRSRKEAVFDDHQSVRSLLSEGCDLVCSSGDKVLGGAQAGLLCGTASLVARCRNHPLYRALRPSRLTLAALGTVLDLHLRAQPLPLDRLFVDVERHHERLVAAVSRWSHPQQSEAAASPAADLPSLKIVPGEAFVGGGSAPDRRILGEVLSIRASQSVMDSLRQGSPPVVGRMREGHLLLDLRTVNEADDSAMLEALEHALLSPSSKDDLVSPRSR